MNLFFQGAGKKKVSKPKQEYKTRNYDKRGEKSEFYMNSAKNSPPTP
jgi:hypothetical protein